MRENKLIYVTAERKHEPTRYYGDHSVDIAPGNVSSSLITPLPRHTGDRSARNNKIFRGVHLIGTSVGSDVRLVSGKLRCPRDPT